MRAPLREFDPMSALKKYWAHLVLCAMVKTSISGRPQSVTELEELEEYGIVARPFVHLRVKSAESIRELVVFGGNVDHYGRNMVG